MAVQRLNLLVGMREDDAARLRIGGPCAIPALNQVPSRIVSRLRHVNVAAPFVAVDRLRCSSGGELPGGAALPLFALPPYVGDLDAAVPLGDRAERGACFDGLKLLGVSDQHDLGAAPFGLGDHALHLARADHAGLVDDEHVAGREKVAVRSVWVIASSRLSRSSAADQNSTRSVSF